MDELSKKQLQDWAEAFSKTEAGNWLKEFDWRKIPFEWSDRCNVDNGIMGMYFAGHIWIMDCRLCLNPIFSTYIHELYHRYQWCKRPWVYLLGKVIRPIIEVPADEVTEAADEWIECEQE